MYIVISNGRLLCGLKLYQDIVERPERNYSVDLFGQVCLTK